MSTPAALREVDDRVADPGKQPPRRAGQVGVEREAARRARAEEALGLGAPRLRGGLGLGLEARRVDDVLEVGRVHARERPPHRHVERRGARVLAQLLLLGRAAAG